MRSHVGNEKPTDVFTVLRVYTRKHRKATAIVVVAAVIAGIATPFAVSALSNGSEAGQETRGLSSGQMEPATLQVRDSSDKHSETKGGSAVSNKNSDNSTNVTVNGESITVPENGSYSKTTQHPGGQTSVNVNSSHSSTSNSGNSSASNTSNSSVNIHVESESSSSSTSQQ